MQMTSSATEVFHRLRRLLQGAAVAAALIIPSAAVQASVIFNFSTSTTAPGAFSGIPIYMEVTDQAYAEGFIDSWTDVTNLFARNGVITPFAPSDINITIGPDDALSGSFLLGGINDTLQMSDSSGTWKGVYSTDAPYFPCNISNTCKFEGDWQIAVPEPASLALLSVGGFAAVVLARRRRGRVR